MQKDIYRKPRLAIISDTAMYLEDSTYVFEPVLREVVSFASLFDSITWLGFGHLKLHTKNSKKDLPANVKLVSVKPSGGNTVMKKIGIIFHLTGYFIKIIPIIKNADVVHTRGPSMPALLAILISFVYPGKKYWHKYAGNWQVESSTLSYRFQRRILGLINTGYIVVSARNNSDHPHILSWENPCLTEEELDHNRKSGIQKTFLKKLTFCFIGRLEEAKGFPFLIDLIGRLNEFDWFDKLHCVGEGLHTECYKQSVKEKNIPAIFHGILDRQKLNNIYAESHFIILPSLSEGFPKVLAEAASFGCIPIVPPIPSVLDCFCEKKKNAVELHELNPDRIVDDLKNLNRDRDKLKILSDNAMNSANEFTYEKYKEKINNDILCMDG